MDLWLLFFEKCILRMISPVFLSDITEVKSSDSVTVRISDDILKLSFH